MKKRRYKILLLFLITLFVISLTACKEEYIEKRVLVEAVKRKADGTLWGKTNYKYDKYGRKIEEVETEDGKLIRKHTWKYDKQGNVIEEYILDLRMGRVEIRYINKYDDNGRMIEHKTINNTDDFPDYKHYKYKYNSQGKVVEEITLNKSGDIVWQEIYDYDEDGRQILYKAIDGKGKEFKVEKWKYNDAGKEIYYVEIIKGQEKKKIIRKFDEKGFKINYKSYINGKLEYNNEYIYDEKGREKKVLPVGDAKESMIFESKYDENNNLIEEKRINKKTKDILIQKWKYDDFGNEIRYIVIENGKKRSDWIWEYDDNRNLIYHEKRNGKGEIEDWEAYEWYENGQMKMSNTPLTAGRGIETYNKAGQLIEKRYIWDDKDELTYWEKYYYNEKGEKEKKVWGREKTTSGYRKYKYKNIKVYKK